MSDDKPRPFAADLSTNHLYLDPDMDGEVYGAVPVGELRELLEQHKEARDFQEMVTGLNTLIEDHTDE